MKIGESFENLRSSILYKPEIDYLNKVIKEVAKYIRQATKNKKFTTIFRRQIFALSFSNDLSIVLSSSGSPFNILSALKEAKKNNVKTLLISGSSAKANSFVDLHINFNSTDTTTIQILTQMLYHFVCEFLE